MIIRGKWRYVKVGEIIYKAVVLQMHKSMLQIQTFYVANTEASTLQR